MKVQFPLFLQPAPARQLMAAVTSDACPQLTLFIAKSKALYATHSNPAQFLPLANLTYEKNTFPKLHNV
jgi:hypothetical protein